MHSRRRLVVLFLLAGALLPLSAGATAVEIWRIGLLDGGSGEFGTAGLDDVDYALPRNWANKNEWRDFPGTWSAADAGWRLRITFSLSAIPAAAYFELGAAEVANAAFPCRAAVNGHELSTQWFCGRGAIAGRAEPPLHAFWAVPVEILSAGENTLTIWSPSGGGPDSGRLRLDYLRLMTGTKNVYKPVLRGAAMWWTTGEAARYGRALGVVESRQYYGTDTFDDDVELLKLWRIGYIYTSIIWAHLERAKGQWHQETLAEYEYEFKNLNSLGIKTWVCLEGVPRWARQLPDGSVVQAPGLQEWAGLCRRLAESLGREVDNWLVGSDIDGDSPPAVSQADYAALLRTARDTFQQYDTFDADGDGIAARVAPGRFSRQNGADVDDMPSFLAREADSMFDSVHYSDFNWGDVDRFRNYKRLFPDKRIFMDGWGSGFWTDETMSAYSQARAGAYPPAQPFAGEPMDEMRYLRLFQEPGFDLAGYAVHMLKGDPNLNNDPEGKGYCYDLGNCWADSEPDGSYLVTRGGAYAQHYHWFYSYDGPLHPVLVDVPDSAPVLVDAVWCGSRLQVLATNFAAVGGEAVTVRLRVPMAAGEYRVKRFDPYYPVAEERAAAVDGWVELPVELTTGARTRTVRWELSRG